MVRYGLPIGLVCLWISILGVLSGAGNTAVAESEFTERFRSTMWRMDLTAAMGYDSGSHTRQGDYYVTGSVEFGWAVLSRGVLGVRLYPLFLYYEEADSKGNSHWIYGAGAGVVGRAYLRKDVRQGWFGELGIAPIWHSRYIERNSSRVNFLSEIGVGYQFRNDWHMTLKWEHLSNANLKRLNSGVNSIALGVGYTF